MPLPEPPLPPDPDKKDESFCAEISQTFENIPENEQDLPDSVFGSLPSTPTDRGTETVSLHFYK